MDVEDTMHEGRNEWCMDRCIASQFAVVGSRQEDREMYIIDAM